MERRGEEERSGGVAERGCELGREDEGDPADDRTFAGDVSTISDKGILAAELSVVGLRLILE